MYVMQCLVLRDEWGCRGCVCSSLVWFSVRLPVSWVGLADNYRADGPASWDHGIATVDSVW